MHDLDEIGVDLPEGLYATVAGLILERLGHLPQAGEAVEVDGWRVVADSVSDRAITQVRLVPQG